MAIYPNNYSLRKFPFVDREECKQRFQNFLETAGQKKYNVLHYYGISGIGKSKLQEELQKTLTEHYPDIIWASVDFKVKTHREIGTFLFSLRSQLAGKYNVKFEHFDIAHAIYWKKVNPDIALVKEKYTPIEEESTVDTMFKILNIFGPFSLFVDIPKYLVHAPERFNKWWNEEGLGFTNKLKEANPNQIEQLLPVFFFEDLKSYLENKSKKTVIFIDTYEALWEEARKIGNFNSKDDWIRNIIALFENSSWVICGKDKIRWNEIDYEWDNYLNQHGVEILRKKHCIKFLESYDISEKDIQTVIIEASEGYPYYLALSVDTYLTIKENGNKPVLDDFPKTRPEIFNSFFHYLDETERSILLILSNTNFWDRNLFNMLTDEFGTNYPKSKTAFDELHNFSFMIENDNVTWSLHPLMKKSLYNYQEPEEKERVHKYLFNYYNEQLNGIDIKNIEEIHKTAFNEAFYHGKQFIDIEYFYTWFSERSDIFDKAGLWHFLIPLFDAICNILENTLGEEHQNVATSINKLAELYCHMGRYTEALPLYEQALEIQKKKLGEEHPDYATSLNNLASLYYSIGKYDEASKKYEKALEIRGKKLGEEHPDVATSINCLAELYCSMGKYDEAFKKYEKALEIRRKKLGEEHPDVAFSLSSFAAFNLKRVEHELALTQIKRALEISENMLGENHPDVATNLSILATLYLDTGKYDEVLHLYERSLNIRKKTYGEEHPVVAASLNNLASYYLHTGEYDKALNLYECSLTIREKTLGKEHPAVAINLNNLAVLYKSMGKYEEALPFYERALVINKKTLGKDHPLYKRSIISFIILLRKVERDIASREKRLSSNYLDVVTSLNNLAVFYLHMEEYEEALCLYKRAFVICEKTLGTDHPTYITTQNNLNFVRLKLGQ